MHFSSLNYIPASICQQAPFISECSETLAYLQVCLTHKK
uniref:Uncharacterized protein n=1 Tax=Anguilla anguilla TaxID=7936 RepID=A0A0E9VU58_ANGAN